MDTKIIAVISAIAVVGVAAVLVVPALTPSPGPEDPVGPYSPDTSVSGLVGTWYPIEGFIVYEDGSVSAMGSMKQFSISIPTLPKGYESTPVFQVNDVLDEILCGAFNGVGTFMYADADVGKLSYSVISNHGYLVMYSLKELNDKVVASVGYYTATDAELSGYSIGSDSSLTVGEKVYKFAESANPMKSDTSWDACFAEISEPKIVQKEGSNPFAIKDVKSKYQYRLSDVSYTYGISKSTLSYDSGSERISKIILGIPSGHSTEVGAMCGDGVSSVDLVYAADNVVASFTEISSTIQFHSVWFDADGSSVASAPDSLAGLKYGEYALFSPMLLGEVQSLAIGLNIIPTYVQDCYMIMKFDSKFISKYLPSEYANYQLSLSYSGKIDGYYRFTTAIDVNLDEKQSVMGIDVERISGDLVCYVSEDLSECKFYLSGYVGFSSVIIGDFQQIN